VEHRAWPLLLPQGLVPSLNQYFNLPSSDASLYFTFFLRMRLFSVGRTAFFHRPTGVADRSQVTEEFSPLAFFATSSLIPASRQSDLVQSGCARLSSGGDWARVVFLRTVF